MQEMQEWNEMWGRVMRSASTEERNAMKMCTEGCFRDLEEVAGGGATQELLEAQDFHGAKHAFNHWLKALPSPKRHEIRTALKECRWACKDNVLPTETAEQESHQEVK